MFGATPFVVQHKINTPDNVGGVVETWSNHMMIHGYIDLITGSDQNPIQNAFTEQSTHILVVPIFNTGITDKMRIVDAMGRYYNITYVDNPVGLNHHLELYLTFGGVE